jgi:hypothetical protein
MALLVAPPTAGLRPLSPGVCAILDRLNQLARAGAGPPSGGARADDAPAAATRGPDWPRRGGALCWRRSQAVQN